MPRCFRHRLRAGYGDTDKSGVVHHAVYLRYLEDARVAMLRDAALDFRQLEEADRVSLVVARADVRYLRPTFFDDEIDVEIRVEKLRGASLVLDYRVLRGEALLSTASITLACIDLDALRPKRIPFRAELERWMEGA
ncbi:MAG: acyl-CoA thioesterase [Myxococcales bacterium]|nr:acyl-CoA thioesterase [Myxococcales bacterium]